MFDYQARNDLLAQRTILVTGAGDGIGRAAALSFARLGATVILLGRTPQKLEAVYDAIEACGGPQPAIIPLNLATATATDYQNIAQQLEGAFDSLDGLLHNAGVLGDMTLLEQYDIDTWMNVMQVNVNATFLLTQALLPLLRRSNDASVTFTSSSVGHKGRAHWGAYAVSKFATEGLMQTWADEVENTSHIRMNSINPGATRTTMRASAYPAEDPTAAPEDILPVYHYLLGPDSKGVTGRAFDARSGVPAVS